MAEIADGRSSSMPGDIRGGLPAGTVLRGYELKSILGKGAFGITYRASDTTLDRDVAIKEYLPTALALREDRTTVMPISADHAEQFAWGRERFLDEARTLARLDRTPAIVRVHDFLEANGTAYMVMALIEGETMNKRLVREQRLAPETIERVLFPLLDGLEEVHAAGFLHRDIKPANIMLDASGRPTLIDFGASRAAMAERSITLTAVFTPGYAAAEQFTSIGLGPWTDIYGLAATLYHAITGQIPPSAVQRILKDEYQPLAEQRLPGYAPALLAGIDAALAVRAEDRPQSIAEWRAALRAEEWRSSAQAATHVTRKPGRLARAANRTKRARLTLRGPALLRSATAAILALAVAGWLAWQANVSSTVGATVQSLSAEQLEQALAERRQADTLAAEKRRLEEEARAKAAADAEAKRQAEAELEQARQARLKAEEELARLKADMDTRRQGEAGQREQAETAARRAAEEEAQRKAEAEAANLRQAEEEAAKKAAADAEAKRQADDALARAAAERQRAEEEARAKAEAEQAAMRQASEEVQRKAAEAESKRTAEAQAKAQAERERAEAEAKAKAEDEAAEKALRLEKQDRERLQMALTSLGFDTRGNDGIFGPRSREMIAAWQKARSQPPTGFVTSAQQQALLKEAASALSKYDEQKKAEEEAKARTAAVEPVVAPAGQPAAASAAPAPTTASPSGAFDGVYDGAVWTRSQMKVSLRVENDRGSGTISMPGCSPSLFSVLISSTGNVDGQGDLKCWFQGAGGVFVGPFRLSGRAAGSLINLQLIADNGGTYSADLRRSGSPGTATSSSQPTVAAVAPAVAPQSPPGGFDGTYTGARPSGLGRFSITLTIAGSRGALKIDKAGCSMTPITVAISPTGEISGRGEIGCPLTDDANGFFLGPVTVTGRASGAKVTLTLSSSRGSSVLSATVNRVPM